MGRCLNPNDLTIFYQDFINHGLPQSQIFLIFNSLPHFFGIKLFICLRPKSPNSRSLTSIEHFHLDIALVNILGHLSAQSIYFTNDNAFCRSSNRGITGHESQHLNIDGCQKNLTTHSTSSQRCLNPSMPCSNHDNIITFSKIV